MEKAAGMEIHRAGTRGYSCHFDLSSVISTEGRNPVAVAQDSSLPLGMTRGVE